MQLSQLWGLLCLWHYASWHWNSVLQHLYMPYMCIPSLIQVTCSANLSFWPHCATASGMHLNSLVSLVPLFPSDECSYAAERTLGSLHSSYTDRGCSHAVMSKFKGSSLSKFTMTFMFKYVPLWIVVIQRLQLRAEIQNIIKHSAFSQPGNESWSFQTRSHRCWWHRSGMGSQWI